MDNTAASGGGKTLRNVVHVPAAGGNQQRIMVVSGGGTMRPIAQSGVSPARTIAMQPKPASSLTPLPMQRVATGGIAYATSRQANMPGSAPGYIGIKRPYLDYSTMAGRSRYPRSTDKSKGLRHFSTKVCEKVKEKGQTTYNEVADELVQEYFDSLSHPPSDQEKQQYDIKNIRRRVYDALNVLMAMNIIEKEKKEIRWVGLPTSSLQECKKLEEEKTKRQERIRQKAEQLQELIIQLVAYKSLVERNRESERSNGRPAADSLLYLPYIVVNTDKRTIIDCSISHDKTEYLFNFDQPFEIHDDIEVLKRLGLAGGLEKGQVSSDVLPKLRGYLPPALRDYADQIVEGRFCGGLVGPSVKPPPAPPAPRAVTAPTSTALPVRRPVIAATGGQIVRPAGLRVPLRQGATSIYQPRAYAPVTRTIVLPSRSTQNYAAGGGHYQAPIYTRRPVIQHQGHRVQPISYVVHRPISNNPQPQQPQQQHVVYQRAPVTSTTTTPQQQQHYQMATNQQQQQATYTDGMEFVEEEVQMQMG